MRVPYPIRLGVLAATYTGVAKLGLSFDAVSGFATLVWPPTGIAIAALVVLGRTMAPAIWIGALAVNVWQGSGWLAATGIATGNTLEALVAAWAIGSLDIDRALARLRSAIGFAIVAVVAPIASASIGVASLYAAGDLRAPALDTWTVWWVGDAIGALVVAPLILTWTTPSPARSLASVEGGALIASLLVGSSIVFGLVLPTRVLDQPYLLFPLVIWSAIRFGPRGASLATFVVAAIAIAATAAGRGAFAEASLSAGLLSLQVFVAFVATMVLVLAALGAERASAAAEAVRNRHDLETALATAHLARALADRASQVKTNFLSLVSHELRTPLATLLLQIQRLALDPDQIGPSRRLLIGSMKAQGSRLQGLIDGLLDYTRIQSGRMTLEVQRFDPASLVNDCADELRLQAEAKGLALAVEIQPGMREHASDPRLIRLIVGNLVGNAIKFTEKGRVTLAVSVADGALRIAVGDTGPGIPDEQKDRIFEPFEQVDPLRHKHLPGIGLGLALVREMTRILEGRILVESEVGRGSTFVVLFPPFPDG
jgi:signal transduction histidine kinase